MTSIQEPDADVVVPLADHIVGLAYDDLSVQAIAAAKLFILDTLAATVIGSDQPGIAAIVDTLARQGGRPDATVAMWGYRLPAHEAVIANVAMAHALEIDDAHYPAIVHPTSPSLWAALATAEVMGGASGRDLITAVAGAVDLMVRLGLAAPRTLYLGYHTALFSGFGAAAAAGKLRRLDAATLRDAFGITFSQAGATVQAATDGALVKRLQPAFNAADGLKAVDLAMRGITGIRNVFEGPYGFYRLFNHSALDRAPLLGELGRRFYGAELTIKRYPTSRCANGPIECALELVRRYDVRPDEVESVVVEVSQGCVEICGAPYLPDPEPSQTFAQFSIPYTVAAAILWRDVFAAQMRPEALGDPAVVALAARVTAAVRPGGAGSMSFTPVTIRLATRDGRVLVHTVEELKGSPERPMSWDEIIAERVQRVGAFSRIPFNQDRIDRLVDVAGRLERLADARDLVQAVAGSPPAAAPRPTPAKRAGPAPAGHEDAIVRVARHVAETTFSDIPDTAREATKKFLLDAIATTIAGSAAPGCAAVADLVRGWGGTAESRIAVLGGTCPAPNAVVANVMMCHALELDDLYDPAVVHATAPSLWATLAAAEAQGKVGGRDALTAIMLGADVMCRIGAAAKRTFALGHHNALLAGFAAVAGAGKIRGASPAVLREAFGIASCQAAASVQALPDGALVKRLQPALNAGDGLRSLRLAEAGVTGVIHVLEGKFGFCRLFGHAACDREALFDGLGARFLGAASSIKRFPSSRCTHAPIEAVLQLKRTHGLEAAAIDEIEVLVSETCVRVAGAPVSPASPSPQVEAQFSIPHTVAAAIVFGDVFIPHVDGELIADPTVRALAERVRVDVLPTARGVIRFTPIEVRVRLHSGAVHHLVLETMRGTPADPLDWDDIVEERLLRCVRYAARPLADATVRRLVEAIRHFEDLDDVADITRLLAPEERHP
ncbi:MmgE/PrpD family protein [Chelatococcus reniformis]|uniref:MmgE/PrpD family protein n=1 Tax=Chelatococcus reniformis TaxID=1494448 RepID=A0A916XEQ0_9HYPH|nr:MmgE/PrpD family protein [Chelatococcus reniformis]GGC66433.1 hypothetical protein GCM10010994_26290 [Chelatococcus reniformis]